MLGHISNIIFCRQGLLTLKVFETSAEERIISSSFIAKKLIALCVQEMTDWARSLILMTSKNTFNSDASARKGKIDRERPPHKTRDRCSPSMQAKKNE
jgi:hypothetical protein